MMLDLLMTPVRKIVGLQFPGLGFPSPKDRSSFRPIEFSVSPGSSYRSKGYARGLLVSLYRDFLLGCVHAEHQGRKVDWLHAWANQVTTSHLLCLIFFIPYLPMRNTRSRSFSQVKFLLCHHRELSLSKTVKRRLRNP